MSCFFVCVAVKLSTIEIRNSRENQDPGLKVEIVISGDVITHIDGMAVHSAKDIYRALESGSELLDLAVARRTGTFHLKVKPENVL